VKFDKCELDRLCHEEELLKKERLSAAFDHLVIGVGSIIIAVGIVVAICILVTPT
jgi:hypothetical protein